jgi:hypothetical protein
MRETDWLTYLSLLHSLVPRPQTMVIQMKIHKTKMKFEYAVIPNKTAQDLRLSFEARGLLTMILSMPDDWVIYKSWLAEQAPGVGRDKLNRMMNELKDNGYIIARQDKNEEGKFSRTDYDVYAESVDLKTVDGFAVDGSSVNGQSTTTKETSLESKQVNKVNITTTRFIQPSLELLTAYMTERNWTNPGFNAEKFSDYYSAKGWKVGKSAMKDWKAAVRTWEKNNKPNEDYNDVPIQPIVKLYNDLLSAKTSYQVSVVSDQLKRDIAKRCRNSQNANNVQWWAQFFAACANRLNHIEPQFRPARYKLDRLVGRDFEEVLNEVNSN